MKNHAQIPPAILAAYEQMSPPNLESWQCICDGDSVFVVAFKEFDGPSGERQTRIKAGIMPIDELKELVTGLKPEQIGAITILLPSDAKKHGGRDLLRWLTKKGRAKGFAVSSIAGPASTKDAISTITARLSHPTTTAH